MSDAAWDRGEGEDGEEIVFVETVSTARRGRSLLFISALLGGLVLGVGIVGALWGGNTLRTTYEEFQRQTDLVQKINPSERDGLVTEAARLDERDKAANSEYWRLRDDYDRLCARARALGRGNNCHEWEWNDPPAPPTTVEPRRSANSRSGQ